MQVNFPSLPRRLNFPEVEFLGTTPNCTKRKKHSSLCVYVLQKTSHKEISRLGRAGEARKMCQKNPLLQKKFNVLVSVAVIQTTSSPPFFLRDSRASETRARVKISLRCSRPMHSSKPVVQSEGLKRLQRRQVKITPREKRRQAPCHLFSRGVIFTRALVPLALLSLRQNGGLLVVYCHPALLKLPNVTQAPQWGRKAEYESKKKNGREASFFPSPDPRLPLGSLGSPKTYC